MGEFETKLCIICDARFTRTTPSIRENVCEKCYSVPQGKKCKQCGERIDGTAGVVLSDLCSTCSDNESLELGTKLDQNKPRYSLVPPDAMEEFVNVLTFGANKYSDNNWKHINNLQDRYYDALQRHLASYRAGDELDDESGMHHLAHAMCCIAFMMQDSIERQPA